APLPFTVDATGLIHLGALCSPGAQGNNSEIKCPPQQPPEIGLFDLQGEPISRCSTPVVASYLTSGTYISVALDSELYRCQWHRVILRGDIPGGTRVLISTFTAEALFTDLQIENLTTDQWDTNQTASDTTDGQFDCLVRSGGGRFLWLRLDFLSNGKATPRIGSVEIEFPR